MLNRLADKTHHRDTEVAQSCWKTNSLCVLFALCVSAVNYRMPDAQR